MYEDRVIAFIDILGFGSLVESSADDFVIVQSLVDALNQLQPDKIQKQAFGSINYELIPKENIVEVEEVFDRIAELMLKQHPIEVSYFSDSIVLSALSSDILATQNMLELIAKINIILWEKHSLLLRGGITFGKLLHLKNGPMFGPAMNRAYYLESQEAIYPRILIDSEFLDAYRKNESFNILEPLFGHDDDTGYKYISLGSSYKYILNHSFIAGSMPPITYEYSENFSNTSQKLKAILENIKGQPFEEKYIWLISDVCKQLEMTDLSRYKSEK
ncbi:hypothetical protein [Thiomicrorhabdus xiamenensis]|uniref:Guanylate cyclase domain-containing protein n=1 Tax=Thiomicrorhabdus xiamenensis TaxID=2739063 RepID=A0A7D4SYA3_9GAMM|nr:hypothetical protein [Thiomicrorhabdus xiamenensis]QKI88904.1 hypothetical protein HQN79_04635 [Thiomicrorhabdus xiamenensis]